MEEKIKELLFDAGQVKPLVLMNKAGKRLSFEQIYATELDGSTYCILRPLERVEGMSMLSALAFRVFGETFRAVRDRELSEKIFAEYYEALRVAKGEDGDPHGR